MKTKQIAIILGLASAHSAFGAIALVNGDFSTNDLSGWTVGGTVSAASGAAVISSGGSIQQDFETGAGLESFTASYDIRFGAINNAHRMRFRSETAADIITLRIASDGTTIDSFNGGVWTTAVSGLSLNTSTNYTVGISGADFGTSSFKYTISISDGTTALGTSVADLNARHVPVNPADYWRFGTFTVGASTGGITVDNFAVVPEPSVAFLGGLGLFALLRRRR